MKVVIYAKQESIPGRKLRKVLEENITQVPLSFTEIYDEFLDQLRRPFSQSRIIVLIASNQTELNMFLDNQDIILNHKIILILGESNPYITSMGHKLHPRFLTQISTGFNDVVAVLIKMLSNAVKISGDEELESNWWASKHLDGNVRNG